MEKELALFHTEKNDFFCIKQIYYLNLQSLVFLWRKCHRYYS